MSNLQSLFDVDPVLIRQEELILEATERLAAVMERNHISKADLARRLGKSKAYVTQCLNGSCNLTLRTLADLFGAVGYKLHIEPRLCSELVYEQICTVVPHDGWALHRQRDEFYDFRDMEPAETSQASALGEAPWTIQ